MTYLSGARTEDWLRLLRDNGFGMSPRYLPRALLITLTSLHNSWMYRRERKIDVSQIAVKRPLFILGHWRSGTTHLQYLLSHDPAFAYPNTYEVSFPNSFLCYEGTHGKLIAPFLPSKRPQDNMALSIKAPNEDEIALAALGLPSLYLFLAFPKREAHYSRFLSFRDASEQERETFKSGLLNYMQKLTWKYGRPLLMKSPTHTARIELLLELYPDARFVHICRDPYRVFQSTLHLHQVWFKSFAFIQKMDYSEMERRVIELYCRLYDAFLDDVHSIPAGQYSALRFEDLEEEPISQLERLYSELSLPAFCPERFRSYLSGLAHYEKNSYQPLAPATKKIVAHCLEKYFRAFGYPL